MNRLVPLLAALGLVALAGCAAPAGAIRFGDTVTVRYDALDLATGEPVVRNGTATLIVGAASSPLGFDVPHALLGHRANDTVRVESRADPGRSFSETIRGDPVLQRLPRAEWSFNRTLFASFAGEPEVGKEFVAPPPMAGERLVVTAVEGDRVYYTPLPQDAVDYGLRVEFESVAEEVVVLLRPLDQRPIFTLGRGIEGTFLNRTGSYQVRGEEGGRLLVAYSPSLDGSLIGRDLAFVVTVVAVTPGAAAGPFAVPQLERDPRRPLAPVPG